MPDLVPDDETLDALEDLFALHIVHKTDGDTYNAALIEAYRRGKEAANGNAEDICARVHDYLVTREFTADSHSDLLDIFAGKFEESADGDDEDEDNHCPSCGMEPPNPGCPDCTPEDSPSLQDRGLELGSYES